jgi:hypothetical protein
MTPAKVVRINAARVVEECDEAPRLPRLYSAKGAAARFDCSRGLLFKLYQEGRLPGYRLLSCDDPRRQPLRFREQDLLALLRPGIR